MATLAEVFGGKVVQLRTQHRLTQRQLATRVGMSHQMVSEIERGQLPSLAMAQRLAQYFQVPLSVLVGECPSRRGRLPDDPIQIRVVHLCRELALEPAEVRQIMGEWLIALGHSVQQARAPAVPEDASLCTPGATGGGSSG